MAAAHGLPDGENLGLDFVVDNLKRIISVTELPVSVDIESGYDNPAQTIERIIKAGAVGCNLEDCFPHDGSLRDVSDQVARIRESRRIADATGIDFFINARTDVFFQDGAKEIEASLLPAALERAHAYANAGADGLFVPGLTSTDLVAQFAGAISLPVNVMVGENSPNASDFAAAGVARISHGPAPYLIAMRALAEAAEQALKA